jgi:hypothetical protein
MNTLKYASRARAIKKRVLSNANKVMVDSSMGAEV